MLRRLPFSALLPALLGSAVLFSAPAASQPAPSGSTAASAPSPAAAAADQADSLYREGLELAKAKEWPKAYQKFLRAYQFKRSFDIATNLGAVEFNLGKYIDAAEHLRYGLSMFPANGKPDQKKAAEDVYSRARSQVGTLRLKLTPADADLKVNDRELGASDNREEVFVEPGDVRVEAAKKGWESSSQTVKVEKGGSADVSVSLKAVAGPGPTASVSASGSPSAAPTTSEGPNRGLVVAGGLVSGIAVITGAVLLGVAEGTRSQLRGEAPLTPEGKPACSNTQPATGANATCDDLRARAAAATTMGQAGIGVLVTGGVLGIGTLVYALWPRGNKASANKVVPIVTANGAGLSWTGSF